MNKFLMILAAMISASATQAELRDDQIIERIEHCMDALGPDFANLDEGRRHRHCDDAAGKKTWGQLKEEMDEQRHKDGIGNYMRTHD
jgi:hypothetical protein